jgi:hypothetical protein
VRNGYFQSRILRGSTPQQILPEGLDGEALYPERFIPNEEPGRTVRMDQAGRRPAVPLPEVP